MTNAAGRIGIYRSRFLAAGAAFSVALAVGAVFDPVQFYQSYLIGYIYWLAIALGCMGFTMVHHLTGGGWGFVTRRILEAGAWTIPFMALLALPILLGMHQLYPWTDLQEPSAHGLIEHKEPYLNVPFFLIRNVLYFAIWSTMAILLTRWSAAQDRTGDPELTIRQRFLSGPGIVVYGLTATFASVDWVMSLEPEWFSTIYGMLFFVSHGLAALAFSIIWVRALSGRPPISDRIRIKHYHDLGTFMFAFVMLWAYLAFSQFLIIWSANLAEEASWYIYRTHHGWEYVALFLVVFQFALPFLILLSRRIKQDPVKLVRMAYWILLVRFIDFFWWIKPAFSPGSFSVHWMDIVAPLAIGGLWLALFATRLQSQELMPTRDPRLDEAFGQQEALHHG